jgi:hypothetical protein
MLKYHPYPANDGKHKYYIITNSGKTIKFGAAGMSDFTIHKDVARKQRERQLKTENFKVAEKIAPTQRDREKLAAQQAAGEMPSLGEQIRGGLSGADPSQLARESAASKFEKDRAITSGLGQPASTAKLGEEQSTLSKETLQAIQALVDLMKSGTVVK